MASTYSPSLRLELIGTGDQSGVWGDTTNNNLGSLIEQAITGYMSIPMTDAEYTLTSLNGSVDQARNAVLVFTSIGSLTTTRDIIIPAVEKTYTIKNSTTGGQAIRIKTTGGAGVTLPAGNTVQVYCDGTDTFTQVTYAPGNFSIAGNSYITGTTTMTGALSASTATFSGAISSVSPTFTGTTTVTGPANITGATTITGSATVSGNLTAGTATAVGGGFTLGAGNNIWLPGTSGNDSWRFTNFNGGLYWNNTTDSADYMVLGPTGNLTLNGGQFVGNGGGLTGTAASLSIGGNAATATMATAATTAASATTLTGNWTSMPAGTVALFAQAAAPTGWTQINTDGTTNRMIRVVNTAGGGTGGTNSPILMDVVPNHTHTYSGITVGVSNDHYHTFGTNTGYMNQNWSHNHGVSDPGHNHSEYVNGNGGTDYTGFRNDTASGGTNIQTGYILGNTTGISINYTDINHTHYVSGNTSGASANHTHNFSGTTAGNGSASNWAPRYLDVIACSKS